MPCFQYPRFLITLTINRICICLRDSFALYRQLRQFITVISDWPIKIRFVCKIFVCEIKDFAFNIGSYVTRSSLPHSCPSELIRQNLRRGERCIRYLNTNFREHLAPRQALRNAHKFLFIYSFKLKHSDTLWLDLRHL